MRTAKQQLRRLPIQADNNYSKREEYISCRNKGCPNVIASWVVRNTGRVFCRACKGPR